MVLPTESSLSGATSSVDLGGSWYWSSVEKLTVPDFVAGIFGIPVEGPVTKFTCESEGTMLLVQIGANFHGPADRTAVSCTTQGGIAFVPSEAFSPAAFDVEHGSIRGASIHFVFGGAPFPTPSHGVIIAVESGVATALRATGRTLVPGHPGSPVPLEPPPAGTSKMVRWEAWRP